MKKSITMMPIEVWAQKEINNFQSTNFLHWVENPQKQVSRQVFLGLKRDFENEKGLKPVYVRGEEELMEGSSEVSEFLQFCKSSHGLQPEDAISPDDFKILKKEFNQRWIKDWRSPFIEGIEGQWDSCWSFFKNFMILDKCTKYK